MEALDSVLSNTEPPPPPPPPVEAAAPPPEQPRADDGKSAPKAEPSPPPTPPKVEMTEKERALLATATEERRKRQELEARLREYQATPKEPPKPFWDDPDGAVKRLEERNQEVLQATQSVATATKLQVSEMIARKAHSDFDEKYEEFKSAVQEAPFLLQQMMQDPDPAEFVYKTAKNRIELRQFGNIDAVVQNAVEKAVKEARAKFEQEIKAKEDEAKKLRESIPPTLSEVAGATGNKTQVWSGPTPLKNILAS